MMMKEEELEEVKIEEPKKEEMKSIKAKPNIKSEETDDDSNSRSNRRNIIKCGR